MAPGTDSRGSAVPSPHGPPRPVPSSCRHAFAWPPGAGRGTAETDLSDWLRELAGPGFRTRADLVEAAVETVADDPEGYPGLTEEDARRLAEAVWTELVERQEGWTDQGDYGRLSAAFDELGAPGVLGRMDFTCCQTCGHAEIGDERADEATWAYTFFHQQDSERLAPGSSDLYLAFGTFRPAEGLDPGLLDRARAGDEDARREAAALSDVRAAAVVTDTLRRHDLTVEWDGTSGQRIRVTGLDWRKRLPA